mgnify:FL=1
MRLRAGYPQSWGESRRGKYNDVDNSNGGGDALQFLSLPKTARKRGRTRSTGYLYRGKFLEQRLKKYGFTRKKGESDWNFRKRIFPSLFKRDAGRAMEFLYGCTVDRLGLTDLTADAKCGGYINIKDIDEESDSLSLAAFANNFEHDPLLVREECAREIVASLA